MPLLERQTELCKVFKLHTTSRSNSGTPTRTSSGGVA
jgi:hypothetical protein